MSTSTDLDWQDWMALGANPTIGAVRRQRGYTKPLDGGATIRRRLAAEVLHLQHANGRGADLRELHRIAERCLAITEGQVVGVLEEAHRWSDRAS